MRKEGTNSVSSERKDTVERLRVRRRSDTSTITSDNRTRTRAHSRDGKEDRSSTTERRRGSSQERNSQRQSTAKLRVVGSQSTDRSTSEGSRDLGEENSATVRQSEGVNHPAHYNQHPSGVEAIDIIEHMSFNVGNAIKYLWRAGLKPGEATLKDIDKALWYLNRERERLVKMGVK